MVGWKVLYYITLAPHFESLFVCKEMSKLIDYHVSRRITDGVMRIPVMDWYGIRLKRSGKFSKVNHRMQEYH